MKTVRGLNVRGFRMELTLQTSDAETHAALSKPPNGGAALGDVLMDLIQTSAFDEIAALPEQVLPVRGVAVTK